MYNEGTQETGTLKPKFMNEVINFMSKNVSETEEASRRLESCLSRFGYAEEKKGNEPTIPVDCETHIIGQFEHMRRRMTEATSELHRLLNRLEELI